METLSAAASHVPLHPLVQEACVHRDLYTDAALFAQEQQRFFGRAWLFAGHGSQMPEVGDYITLELSGQPVLLLLKSLQIRVMQLNQRQGLASIFYSLLPFLFLCPGTGRRKG
jgi:hypothetical protein